MDSKIFEFQRTLNNSSYQESCACSRRRSLSSSFSLSRQVDVEIDCDSASEAGDIGDRALSGNKFSGSGRRQISFVKDVPEKGMVVPIDENILLQPSDFLSQDHTSIYVSSLISPSTTDIMPPLSFQSGGKEKKDDEKQVSWLLEYVTCILSLAVFGIFGVLARYGLEKLFGPETIGATSDQSYMYADLPSNMVGSFLMGWFGVVFKGEIAKVSDQLAIGLTTGFLGSLTTFSGWNQKMLELSANNDWVFALLGILLGLELVSSSIVFGIETAKGFKWCCTYINVGSFFGSSASKRTSTCNRSHCTWTFAIVLALVLGLLWGFFGYLEKKEFETGSSEAQLFLACLVGPVGVWIRWLLARLNGQGIGKTGALKWIPFGTLAANVLAACIMTALATLKKEVQIQTFETVATGMQFGLLGCLSTVSTFIAEFHSMRQTMHPWRAYAYASITILISFVLGTAIYSVPIWTKSYD